MCGQYEPPLTPMTFPLWTDSAKKILSPGTVTSWILQLSAVSAIPSFQVVGGGSLLGAKNLNVYG